MTEPSNRVYHVAADALTGATAQTFGMRRLAAISGSSVGAQALWMGRSHVSPGTNSEAHHHGHSETGIFVVSGHPVFIYLEDGREVRIETAPGDFVYVPPFVHHMESNPSPDEEAVVVIARTTQEAIVENLGSL
ncbi:MAG TPA: cupin domain-containing protein [Chloroflexota bacterium]|nr:cupin domain-containing protein [Chloroflexota bacterium]